MPIFKFVFAFQWRSGGAKAQSEILNKVVQPKKGKAEASSSRTSATQTPAPQEPAPRSVLPRPPGGPARANFGVLKPKAFGRAPVRR